MWVQYHASVSAHLWRPFYLSEEDTKLSSLNINKRAQQKEGKSDAFGEGVVPQGLRTQLYQPVSQRKRKVLISKSKQTFNYCGQEGNIKLECSVSKIKHCKHSSVWLHCKACQLKGKTQFVAVKLDKKV